MRHVLSTLLLLSLLAPAADALTASPATATGSDQASTPIDRGMAAAPGPKLTERFGSSDRDRILVASEAPCCRPTGHGWPLSASAPLPPPPLRTASLYLSHCALLC